MPLSSFPTDNMANHMAQIMHTMTQSYAPLKFAKIADFDPKKCRVKVNFYNPTTREFDMTSNWLKYMTTMQGRGDNSDPKDGSAATGELWGHVFTPNIGEQVMLVSPDGDLNIAIVIGSIYTDKRPPPTTPDGSYTQSGEWFYKNKSKSYLKYWNNGDVWVKATHNLRAIVDNEADVYILSNANVFIGRNANANISGNGNVNVGGSITINAQGSTIVNTGGDTTVNAGGNITLNANGSMVANVAGNLTAQATGMADLRSEGTLTLESNGDIHILARKGITMYGNSDVLLASPVAVYAVAPIAFEATVEDVIVPPLTPIGIVPPNLGRPEQPARTIDPDEQVDTDVFDPPAPADPTANNITDTGVDINFTDGLA